MNRSLIIFRLCFLALLLFLAARPTVVRPLEGAPRRWAILVDVSRSMAVKDPVERLGVAKSLALAILKKNPESQIFSFAKDVTTLDPKNFSTVTASGAQSNLAQAFHVAFASSQFKGAILLSDGRQVGVGDPVSEAVAAGKPIVTVGLGDQSIFKDIAVRSIQNPPFAFKNIPLSLVATISAIGFEGQKISVRLKEGERILGIQTVNVAGHDIETAVTFSWTPESIGSKILTVDVGDYQGEVTRLNNHKSISFDVGRDRFRVLYICGVPGPEYNMLRYQFKSDPAVELVTFVILRNAQNTVNLPDSELSLIPFPTQDVLIQQLSTFDLIVFEEFAYRQFGLMPNIMYAIRKKVEDGGAFLLMGGPAAFKMGGDYDIPGVREIIPVNFYLPSAPPMEGFYKFEAKALQHPILRLDSNPDQNKKMWSQMKALDGFVPVPSAKPGATVLGASGTTPLLTVWKVGQGRVAALATRTTWRWSLNDQSSGAPSGAYQQFWKNMVLWLTRSDDTNSVRLALDGGRVRLGEIATLRAWVFDEYFKPMIDVEIKMSLKAPDGTEQVLSPRQESDGVFSAVASVTQLGAHQATLWAFHKGKKAGQDKISFNVIESHVEEEDLRPDTLLLKELAKSTNGRFFPADGFSAEALNQFDEELKQTSGRRILIWNSPWVFFLILFFLIGEWILRKHRGLP